MKHLSCGTVCLGLSFLVQSLSIQQLMSPTLTTKSSLSKSTLPGAVFDSSARVAIAVTNRGWLPLSGIVMVSVPWSLTPVHWQLREKKNCCKIGNLHVCLILWFVGAAMMKIVNISLSLSWKKHTNNNSNKSNNKHFLKSLFRDEK